MSPARSSLSLTLALATLLAPAADASSSGRIGRSLPEYAGCGNCHGEESSQVAVSLAGPTDVDAGGTYSFELRLSGGPLSAGGFNAAASSGTLVPGEGSQKVKEELTHLSPQAKAPGEDQVRFAFQWVAPAYAGVATLTAVANSVNLSASPEGDAWGRASPLDITVNGPQPPDAGAPSTADAGVLEPGEDGRPSLDREAEFGGCTVAGGGLGPWLLALWALRRRRRP